MYYEVIDIVIICCSGLLHVPVIRHGLFITWGTWWHGWLTYCTTNQKVTGSISDGFIGIFY